MNLRASVLLVSAMVVGLVATGCKSQDKQITDTGNDVASGESTAATPADDPAVATVAETENTSGPGTEKDWGGYHYWAGHAPPAARFEHVGAARSGHFWRPGYYGWSGRDYAWNSGAYYPERAGYRYVNPGWYAVGPRWGYRRGYWVRH